MNQLWLRSLVITLAALAAHAAHAQVKADSAWARPTAAGQKAGGGFVALQSATADKLLGGSTPAAGRVELHTMKMEGDVMTMRQVDSIELPAGSTVKLAPGGLHLMFMDLKAPLKPGDSVPVTLKFEKAGPLTVTLKVSPTAP